MAGTAVDVRPPATSSAAISRPQGAGKGVAPPAGAKAATAAGGAAQAIGQHAPQPPKPARPQSGAAARGSGARSLPRVGSVSPHTAVVLSMVGTGVVIVISDAVEGAFPRPRAILGLGVVYVALAALADLSPRLAVPFSALVFTGVLLTKGSHALAGIQSAVNAKGPINPYSAHDTAVLNTSPGFLPAGATGHPGGPSRQLPPNRQKGRP